MPLNPDDYDEIYLEPLKSQKGPNKKTKEKKNGKYTTKHIRIQQTLFAKKTSMNNKCFFNPILFLILYYKWPHYYNMP